MMGASWLFTLALLASPTPESILAELNALDRSLAAREPELRLLEEREKTNIKDLFDLQAELSQRRLRAAEVQLVYQRRLRALHRMPSGARMVAIGQSSSLEDYLSTARMLRWITHYDRNILLERQSLVEKVEALETRETRELEAAQALTKSVRTLRNTLASERATRLRWVHRVLTEPVWQQLMTAQRGDAVTQLHARFSKLIPESTLSPHFNANRSRLPWPVIGPIGLRFGQLETTGTRTRLTSRGLHLQAKAGTPVQAIAQGKVVYADWLEGYGNVVIIDHSSGYHSLSAHLSAIDVTVGKFVSTQELIGTVGDTGSTRGTEFYFEIRDDGQAVDPLQWLKQ